jgi:nucleotide-binding universal stress UspA family protein
MTKEREELRVLLPTKPQDDLEDVTRVLEILPLRRVHARCLYVHRPVETDFFIPESDDRSAEIARLEFEAEGATRFELEHRMERLAAAGCRVSAEVVRGTPAEEVIHEEGFWKADLVAVRTRSLEAHDHRIGGMASALLYHGTSPVLTYHRVAPGFRCRRILIPTDFSKASRSSVDWGLALAGITGADIVLLHVVAQWNGRHGIDQGELFEIARAELERWKARANSVFPDAVETARVVTASIPAEGILRSAREEGSDLIVLSATGASVVRSILVGANTRHVVRASSCPVLVIPASNRVRAEDFFSRAVRASAKSPEATPEPAGARRESFMANRF